MVDRLVAASKADREQRESDPCDRIEPHDLTAELDRLRAERDEARKIHDGLVGQIAAMSLELIEARGELDRARTVLDAAAAWHETGSWFGHPLDLAGMAEALRAVIEAWDTYTAKEAPVP